MSEIDPITGLPKELSSWDNITKEGQKIIIKIEKRKFGKQYTVIKGIDTKDINIKDIAKKLKSKFACGGTSKEGIIELQGNHKQNVKAFLVELGFSPEMIELANDRRR